MTDEIMTRCNVTIASLKKRIEELEEELADTKHSLTEAIQDHGAPIVLAGWHKERERGP